MKNKLYHKIETLFKFNHDLKGFEYGNYYNKTVELLKDNMWYFTEKVDGTNFRIIWDGYNLSYGGRTNKTEFDSKIINYIENTLLKNKEIILEQLFNEKEVIIYGELYGGKIQGGKYNKELQFKVFDILVGDVYLEYINIKDIANTLGYDYVPLVFINTIEYALKYIMETDKSTFANETLEGLIGKPLGDLRDRLGKRIIVKIKKRDIKNSF